MGHYYDKELRQVVSYSKFNKEVTYIAEDDNNVKSFEDKLFLGTRQEPDGTTTIDNNKGQLQKGLANKLQGTIAGMLGVVDRGHTKRGNNVQITKARRVFKNKEFII